MLSEEASYWMTAHILADATELSYDDALQYLLTKKCPECESAMGLPTVTETRMIWQCPGCPNAEIQTI